MEIKADVDIDLALQVTAAVLKKTPYATNNAITRVAKETVQFARGYAGLHLQIRNAFIQRQIKILEYSRVGNLTCVIGVNQNVQGSPLLLGFLEEGGTKLPQYGSGIAVPITGSPARPSFRDRVPSGFRYKNLQLSGGKGRKKTFVIPGVGVFERVSSGGRTWDAKAGKNVTTDRSATPIIYAFKPSAPIHARLQLRQVMLDVITDRFATIFAEEFAKEVTTRKGKA